ncbi:MAG TPA: bifunctional diguanylate cyclase/phosphodiesterase [Polyangiaceae bacterium]|nr:bifunctional diguanylate cyclase/phosphodiesterase [Polyangiaceae bacterium]
MRRAVRSGALSGRVNKELQVFPVFQPIVDLITGSAIGYEVLSRGVGHDSAEPFFREARRHHGTWEIERACRLAAIQAISALTSTHPTSLFFLNVSPDVLEDPRFVEGFTMKQLRHHGIDPSRIVIEITEKTSIENHDRFRSVVAHYTQQGFQFAIDDFGSGHSSLIALVSATPRYIKLDMDVVRDVHRHSYRRHLVRSLNAFSASVDSRLVAEGVETWEELETLLRLGVRYAQGFLLARPSEEPPPLSSPLAARLRQVARAVNVGIGDLTESIDSLVEPTATHPLGSITVEQLEVVFRDTPDMDHVVFVDEGRPRGLVTRDHLALKLAGRYGYAVHQFKPAERVAKQDPLAVSSGTLVTALATRAMDRAPPDLYDPIIVVDGDGNLVGSIRVRALIKRSVELQVLNAQGANPLTGLPGNRAIHRWLEEGNAVPSLAVLYADLDRFKEYNDRYGFLMGDELIRLAARVLTRTLVNEMSGARLGHVGGDDFVAFFPEGISEDALRSACEAFDAEKQVLFDPEDLARGHLEAKNRRGLLEQVPLVTLSLSLIDCRRIEGEIHPAMLSQLAASLKKRVKEITADIRKSAFVVERRSYRALASVC